MAGRPEEATARLAALREATLQRMHGLESSFEGIVEAARDVATDDEHDPEGHTIAWERQQFAALLRESKLTIAEIHAAEERLRDGVYGTCTSCERNIAEARLEALPATALCVNCAS